VDGDGNIPLLADEALVRSGKLAAIEWGTMRTPSCKAAPLQKEAMQHCVVRVQELFGNLDLWLLTGHSGWEDATRITRYYGLWKRLRRSVSLPDGVPTLESSIESPKGIRYFGAMQFSSEAADTAISIWRDQPTTNLIALGQDGRELVEALIDKGWDNDHYAPNPALVAEVTAAGGVIFWPFGLFDDPDVGCAVLAHPELIAKITL
jgi:hypothetical protein